MAYVAKQTTRRLDGGQVAFVRFVVGLLAVALQALARRAPLRPVRYDLLVARGFFGGIAVLLYFLAIEQLPTGTATLLNYTAPVFTAVFAGIFLREHLPVLTFAAMGIAGIGITLVVLGQGRALGGAYSWQLVALGSAVASGAAVTSIRAARRTDGAWEVFAAFCLLGVICTAPVAIANWRAPTPNEWWLLVAVGLLAVVAQVIMTHALGAVEAAVSGIIAQITVATAISLGYFLDDEPLTGMSFVGALLTLAGVSLAANVSAKTLPTHRELT
jgi:drug/metabolite transporter (DMT)-like permease